MKPAGIFLYCFFLKALVFGQSNAVEIFNSHKFPCDAGTSTLEINLCAGIKSQYADSLLNAVYKKIITSINKEIIADKNALKKAQAKKDQSTENKDNIGFLTKEIDYNQRLKLSIITSQNEWIKLRNLNSAVVQITCEGGRACVAIDNLAEIDDILERITKLLSFYDIYD